LATETLTFLFTDIEGSTALLQRLGDEAYADVLAAHGAIIRAALVTHGGHEVGTQGDGFFAVFSSPRACVVAVVEVQRSIAARGWPQGEQVRVRMGVHVGEATETTAGPVGLDVHRCARGAAVAHGGQVVLSAAAVALVRHALPPGASLRDLGRHRLKDLGLPEQIFQLDAEGLGHEFPPLRSLDNPELPNNLPSELSSFIGRQAELEEVRALVESTRLVTLAGAGGSGKTRLALQVAAELLDGSGEGVWFVDLSLVTDPESVAGSILSALGARGQVDRPPLEHLVDVLHTQRVLLVLDNCEHLVDACAKAADLVRRSCGSVHVLATSREPLGTDGEHVYRLRPLSLPAEGSDSVEALAGSEAVQLFVERARARDGSFVLDGSDAALVASICRRLDGVPFAIELAAARLSTMSLVDLHDRLDQRFRLLTGGSRTAVARQRTLQATVDWSYDLLDQREQQVLCLLSVFSGSFDLAAAEAVCAPAVASVFDVADAVGSLVSKSLVAAERSSGALRYRLLETVRQYGADQLARGGGEAAVGEVRGAHAGHYLKLAEEAAPELFGRGQATWLTRLDPDWDNMRTALEYLSAEGRSEEVLRLGAALWRFFASRGYLEPIAALKAALERSADVPDGLRGRGLLATGGLVSALLGPHSQRETLAAVEFSDQAVQIARRTGDQRLLAESLALGCSSEAFVGDSERATVLGQESLAIARDLADPRLVGDALSSLALAHAATDSEGARELLVEALAEHRRAGDALMMCLDMGNLAAAMADMGRVVEARPWIEETIASAEEIGFRSVLPNQWAALGMALLLDGELEKAVPLCRKALLAARRADPRSVVSAIENLALCAAALGDQRRAAQLTGAFEVLDAELVASAPALGWRSVPWQLRMREDHRARLGEALGGTELERCLEAGRRMRIEEACDLALGKTGPK